MAKKDIFVNGKILVAVTSASMTGVLRPLLLLDHRLMHN
jgi:hypothetical protein